MKVTLFLFLLLFVTVKNIVVLFSSISRKFSPDHITVHANNFVSPAGTKYSNLVLFLALNVIIMAIMVLGIPKPSSSSGEYDVDSFSHDHSPPLLGEAEDHQPEDEEKPSGDHNDQDHDADDAFVPRLVSVKYYDGGKAPLLLEYFGNDDDDDDGYEQNSDDEDFARRVEDFIAKNNRKWREEMASDGSG